MVGRTVRRNLRRALLPKRAGAAEPPEPPVPVDPGGGEAEGTDGAPNGGVAADPGDAERGADGRLPGDGSGSEAQAGEEEPAMEDGQGQRVTEAVTATATETAQPAAASAPSGEVVAKFREYVVRANPDAVPELIAGASIEELEASVGPAKAAYTRVADAARAGAQQGTAAAIAEAQAGSAETPPVVPAGGNALVIDPAAIPAGEKIRMGLSQRQGR